MEDTIVARSFTSEKISLHTLTTIKGKLLCHPRRLKYGVLEHKKMFYTKSDVRKGCEKQRSTPIKHTFQITPKLHFSLGQLSQEDVH
ncbi:hypothetical protein P5673_001847 [Acropora cervicornis]|uniref:Uncharacterized protein n=1 Tax=Acropora cervicornis TaxID=6130 RepID=A0AAD9R4C8_ACRCE|nr:hypothetical protein P5673_001847 [Acropora cervicornis]